LSSRWNFLPLPALLLFYLTASGHLMVFNSAAILSEESTTRVAEDRLAVRLVYVDARERRKSQGSRLRIVGVRRAAGDRGKGP